MKKHVLLLFLAMLPMLCSLLALPALQHFRVAHPLVLRLAVAGLQYEAGPQAGVTERDYDHFFCWSSLTLLRTVVTAYPDDFYGLYEITEPLRDMDVFTAYTSSNVSGRQQTYATVYIEMPHGLTLHIDPGGEPEILRGSTRVKLNEACG